MKQKEKENAREIPANKKTEDGQKQRKDSRRVVRKEDTLTQEEPGKKPQTVPSYSSTLVWPKFLYITTPKEGSRLKLPHFAAAKAIMGKATKPESLKRLRNGDYIAEMNNALAIKTLLATTSLAGQEVSVTPHRSLNSCKGTIHSALFRDCADEDIKELLSDQGVTRARRINRKVKGQTKPTDLIAVTFFAPTPPKEVSLPDGTVVKVGPFFPKPWRCFRCQDYGHTKRSCKRKVRCSRCSQVGHSEKDCRSESASCFHCSGDHPVYSLDCPRWETERHIIKVQVRQKITHKEAREKVSAEDRGAYAAALKSPKPAKVVSKAAQTPTKPPQRSMSTQTAPTSSSSAGESFTVELLQAKVLSLEAKVRHLQNQLKEAGQDKVSPQTGLHPIASDTKVPEDPRFGITAKAAFETPERVTHTQRSIMSKGGQDGESASQGKVHSSSKKARPSPLKTSTPTRANIERSSSYFSANTFNASTPGPVRMIERSPSFHTADELTPITHKHASKTTSQKPKSDASYLMGMLDSVQGHEIEALIGDTPLTSTINEETGSTQVCSTTCAALEKQTPESSKDKDLKNPQETVRKKPTGGKQKRRALILSPKEKPPVNVNISPCYTRGGTLFRH